MLKFITERFAFLNNFFSSPKGRTSPNEKALKSVAPPPPEYMLITCISEFLVSNCENAFFKASWSIPANGI